MKITPALFNRDMVIALLKGLKSQNRIAFKHQPICEYGNIDNLKLYGPEKYEMVAYNKHGDMVEGKEIYGVYDEMGDFGCDSPWGEPGDLVWVRETTSEDNLGSTSLSVYAACNSPVLYSDTTSEYNRSWAHWWYKNETCPSIHMPRWASRLTLEITNVRVERVRNISEEDCHKEGIKVPRCDKCGYSRLDAIHHLDHHLCGEPWWPKSAIPVFGGLWESLYENWYHNPYVWVYEFKVHMVNVDQLVKQMAA